MGDMPAFDEALKAVYGPSHQLQAPLRSSDGSTLLSDNNKKAILRRWSNHFEVLFSDQRNVQESPVANIPQVVVQLNTTKRGERGKIRRPWIEPEDSQTWFSARTLSPPKFSLCILHVVRHPGIWGPVGDTSDGERSVVVQQAAEAWVESVQKLGVRTVRKVTFDLRSILGVKWQDYVSDEEVIQRACLPSTESTFLRRRTHAQSSLLRWAPRRKAWSSCFRKTLQRPAEATACKGWNRPSAMAAGGLIRRQLALISEKSQL